MLSVLAVAVGRITRLIIRIFRRGGGSAFPGTVSSLISPRLLKNAIGSAKNGLVVVSGSSGKSSTTQIIVALLRAHGYQVFTNPSTANIKQGLYAAILVAGDYRGRIDADFVVLELDEGHGAALVESLEPRLAVLTNVYSDQLDRFIDPELVVEKLKAIYQHSKHAVVNVDDKNLTQFVQPEKVSGFGLASNISPRPQYALNFGPSPVIRPAVEVAGVDSGSVRILAGGESFNFRTKSDAPHQALNLAAAIAALQNLIEPNWDLVVATVSGMSSVFARDEIAAIAGKDVRFLLCLNPTSFSLSLDEITAETKPLMIMAGSDIHDPSWLWTVDFSKLKRVDIVAGKNAHDLALRLMYQDVEVGEVIVEADRASDTFLELTGPSPTVLFSADAMRRTRRHLGLAK